MQITNDQNAVLTLFADQFGRNWKSELRRVWNNERVDFGGRHGDDYNTLYCMRNSHGPSWLRGFRLARVARVKTQTTLTIEDVNAAVAKLRAVTNTRIRRRCLSEVGGEESVDAEGQEFVTAGIHAPSLFAWAVAHGGHKPDTDRVAKVLSACWGLPQKIAVEVVTGKRPYEVDPADQAVIVCY